jgi:TatA/E family protein of Tat protein translocase
MLLAIATILAFQLGMMEIGIILFVIFFFFGAKRIPGIASALGKSISEFKKGKEEGDSTKNDTDLTTK